MADEKKQEVKKNKHGVPMGVHLELSDIRKMQAAQKAKDKAE